MKKFFNRICGVFTLLAASLILALCAAINATSECTLTIYLPGTSAKAVDPDKYYYEVTVENSFSSYKDGEYAGNSITLKNIPLGTYTVTCNAKNSPDSIITLWTDSRTVHVTTGNNIVNLMLDSKDNGAGLFVWRTEDKSGYGEITRIKLFNPSKEEYIDLSLSNRESTLNNIPYTYGLNPNGTLYYSDDSGLHKRSASDDTIIGPSTYNHVRVDDVTNQVFTIDKHQGDYTLYKLENDGSPTKLITLSLGSAYFDYSVNSKQSVDVIHDNVLYICVEKVLYAFKLPEPGNNTLTADDAIQNPINLPEKFPLLDNSNSYQSSITDLIYRDGALYLLATYDEKSNEDCGAVLKFNINPDHTINPDVKITGTDKKYITDIPYYIFEGPTSIDFASYLYKNSGTQANPVYEKITTYHSDSKLLSDINYDSTFLYKPIRFAGSLPGCLAIVDSSLTYDIENKAYTNRSRIKYLDLATFTIKEALDLPTIPPVSPAAGSTDPFDNYGFRPLYENKTSSGLKEINKTDDAYHTKTAKVLAEALGIDAIYYQINNGSFVPIEDMTRDTIKAGFVLQGK